MAEKLDWARLFSRLRARHELLGDGLRKADGQDFKMRRSYRDEIRVEDRQRAQRRMEALYWIDQIAPGLGARLHAARLAAKIPNVGDAARLLGTSGAIYRSIESGESFASPHLVEAATRAFDVSLDYLLLDKPNSDQDEAARRIVGVLDRLRSMPQQQGKEHGDRLKAARRAAGFRTADEAMERFGWKPSVYRQHEAGLRQIPLDRLVVYAEAYGTDAVELAVGGSTTPIAERDDRAVLRSHARHRETSWPWLRSPVPKGDMLSLQILRLDDEGEGLVIAGLELPLHRSGEIVSTADDDVFAVLATVRKDFNGCLFLILRRDRGEQDVDDLVVSDGAAIIRSLQRASGMRTGDPLLERGTLTRPLILGRQIGEVRLHWG